MLLTTTAILGSSRDLVEKAIEQERERAMVKSFGRVQGIYGSWEDAVRIGIEQRIEVELGVEDATAEFDVRAIATQLIKCQEIDKKKFYIVRDDIDFWDVVRRYDLAMPEILNNCE